MPLSFREKTTLHEKKELVKGPKAELLEAFLDAKQLSARILSKEDQYYEVFTKDQGLIQENFPDSVIKRNSIIQRSVPLPASESPPRDPAAARSRALVVLNRISVPGLWKTSRGEGSVVAIIDSGVDFSHPDLLPSQWINPSEGPANEQDDDDNGFVDDSAGWDFGEADNDPSPNFSSHGTHSASVVAARTLGVAPQSRILALKVSSRRSMDQGSVNAAILYAINKGVKIVNLSIGSTLLTDELDFVLQKANREGVLIVASSGNRGLHCERLVEYPAAAPCENIISVAASLLHSPRLAAYSNHVNCSL